VTALTVGVLKERATGENRVALDPEIAARLTKHGYTVAVESDAGTAASFADADYKKAGASVTDRAGVLQGCDALLVVRRPDTETLATLRSGQLLLGLVDPLNNLDLVRDLAARGVTVAAFELLPRTLSRAQSMDALSSQASTAGYRATIVAAAAFGRYFSMMITASGTARPANIIVIGTGVAGLQAIGTAKRLGAVVTGYDVRPASRGEVESLGALFQTSSIAEGAGAGGYARAMSAAEQAQQQEELAASLPSFDVVITTARVPGRTPPVLVSEETLSRMRPGTVCVDLAASDRGGNVAGSVDGARTVTDHGVVVIGAGNLASDLATSSSHMYARNVAALLASMVTDGVITVDVTDEVHAGVVVCHEGQVTSPVVRGALGLGPLAPEDPEVVQAELAHSEAISA
jgi:H+-translocating NAD(P) transhydrogenase subunit alpha